jgi:histone deacetylase 1/2
MSTTSLLVQLRQDFAVKDLGDLSYFLGIEVHATDDGLSLCQRKYILDLLKKTNMVSAKSCTTPMAVSDRLSKGSRTFLSLVDATQYRSVVGALQYVTLTRSVISYSVNKVCQFLHSPTDLYWTVVKRILQYLQGIATHGLLLRRSSSLVLSAFSDANWAGCPDDRQSIGGHGVFFGGNLVAWNSKKQPTVSRSSTKAEYKSVGNAIVELMWLQRELGLAQHLPPSLWCDNIGATYLSIVNPVFHARTKHIEIDYHFVHEQVTKKALEIRHISTHDPLADVLTKPLMVQQFERFRSDLNVLPTFRSREDVKITT